MLCKNKVTQAARALHENPGQYLFIYLFQLYFPSD